MIEILPDRPQLLPDSSTVPVIVHPSYFLKLLDEARRAERRVRFVEALKRPRGRAAA